MAIISQQTWDNMPKEEKEKIIKEYSDMMNEPYLAYAHEYAEKCEYMEHFFGKENLRPKPKIKTWEDVLKSLCEGDRDGVLELFGDICCATFMDHGCSPICKKMIATYQIAKLIELGYGGMVTDEEWKNYKRERFWGVECEEHTGSLVTTPIEGVRAFPSFHTLQQAEEFMSYPENVELVKQYYMI